MLYCQVKQGTVFVFLFIHTHLLSQLFLSLQITNYQGTDREEITPFNFPPPLPASASMIAAELHIFVNFRASQFG